ncbi:NACHT domain-containing protein [Streptomyces antimycoticus]|uniref:NACHT domain-containing protein n=1 Tax=Streptomyces antimycoticus TaxID=68175 RepID=UPI0036E8CB44
MDLRRNTSMQIGENNTQHITYQAAHAGSAAAGSVDLETAAGQLAVAVKTQWDDEAAVRRVNDPYPLPVAWRAADDDLSEPWSQLTDLARSWPGGPPGDPTLWPHDAAGLAGTDTQIAETFADWVPTRRLVILGEPGAGKSVLLIRLLQDLIERRTSDSPVPVLFSLASWNPCQPLKTWLAEQLRRSYPGLAAPTSASLTGAAGASGDLAQALLDTGRILPLLDGFDELPPAWHAPALDTLNRTLPPKQPLALASRTDPYQAVSHLDTTVRLNGAATIQLLPLTPDSAADYLRRDAGGPQAPAAARWDAVAAQLDTASPVGQALSTPLGLFLARTIYNPRPHTTPTTMTAHPDELCDTTSFPDRAALESHLFRAFIPAAYAPGHPRAPRWTAGQAHRTFVFLAKFLQNQREGSPDLAWWELCHALPARTRHHKAAISGGLVVGLASGLAVWLTLGLVGVVTGTVRGFVIGPKPALLAGILSAIPAALALGAMFEGQIGGTSGTAPCARVRWRPKTLFGVGAVTLPVSIVVWIDWRPTAGLVLGIAAACAMVFEARESDLTTVSTPGTLFSLDRRTCIALGCTAGIGMGLADGIMVTSSAGLVLGLTLGISTAISVGSMAGAVQTAWGYFAIAQAWLVLTRKVPWNLMAFLQDAHEHRGVLRQVGPVYQFRHIDLQRHLAQKETTRNGHRP